MHKVRRCISIVYAKNPKIAIIASVVTYHDVTSYQFLMTNRTFSSNLN